MSKFGVFSGPYFPAFSPNKGKYRPENTPYLDIFHAVQVSSLKSAHEKESFCSDFIFENKLWGSTNLHTGILQVLDIKINQKSGFLSFNRFSFKFDLVLVKFFLSLVVLFLLKLSKP